MEQIRGFIREWLACGNSEAATTAPKQAVIERLWYQYAYDREDKVADQEGSFLNEARRMWKEHILANLANTLATITQPVLVYDTGYDLYGAFKSGAEAAEMLAICPHTDWWAIAELPTWEIC